MKFKLNFVESLFCKCCFIILTKANNINSMHKISLLILFLSLMEIKAQSLDMKDIRVDFKYGVKDENICLENLNLLSKYAGSSVEKGYLAAYQIFMAKHTFNPFKKMSHFNKGKDQLEELIAQEPENVELRYIRLCIQFYSPKILGYQINIEEDKMYVMNNLYKLKDKDTRKLIYDYLEGAKMYTDEQLAILGR